MLGFILGVLCVAVKTQTLFWKYSSPKYDVCTTAANKRVAVVLIGQSFRSGIGSGNTQTGDKPCNSTSFDSQREAYKSVRKNIVDVFEQCGAKVYLIVVSLKECRKMTLSIVPYIFKRPNTVFINWDSMDQGAERAYNFVKQTRSYDYVLTLRQDIYISQPISKFPVTKSWRNILFEQICPEYPGNCACRFNNTLEKGNSICTKDHMWWAPFHYYTRIGYGAGHGMLVDAMRIVNKKYIGFLFPHDYCQQFVNALPTEPDQKTKNATYSWYKMSQQFGDSYFHLLCIQEFAYRPMRRYSGSLSSWIY